MLVVAALGGNALLKRGEPLTADIQRNNVRTVAQSLAAIVRAGHDLVITHGNGPQVGLLALQGASYKPDEAYPLDVLGADALLLLTDVDAVYRDFGTDQAAPVSELTVAEARALTMPAGSMGPKLLAACEFAETGGLSGIGRLQDAVAILEGSAGTRVSAG